MTSIFGRLHPSVAWRASLVLLALIAFAGTAFAQAPTITSLTSPRQVVTKGQDLTLSVTATGATSYQWKRNGLPISGATSASHTLFAAQPLRDNGWYQVVATNANGSTSSAAIFVLVAPAVTQVIGWGENSASVVSGIPNVTDGVAVAAGQNAGVVVRKDGTVQTWGTAWSPPAGLTDVVAVAQTGSVAHLALKSDGTVVGWGSSFMGVLPVPSGLNDVVKVAGGDSHALALKRDGTVVAWGASAGAIAVPSGLNNVVGIAAGPSYSLAVKADGSAVGWGANGSGQSNLGGVTNVQAVAAGVNHSLVVKRDGSVLARGSNQAGEGLVPVTLSQVAAVAAGGNFSLALRSDGTVTGWGTSDYNKSVVPTNLNAVFAISAAFHQTLALRDASGDLAPAINAQPASVTALAGQDVTISIGASAGTALINYQWRKGGVAISGATQATLTLPRITAADAGSYDVVLSNQLGTVTSQTATLTFNSTPAVGTNLTGRQVVSSGSTVTLTALPAISNPLTYQWRRNGRDIAGATSVSLPLNNVNSLQAGAYQVRVTNASGVALSEPVWIVVAQPSQVVAFGYNSDAQSEVPAGLADAVSIAAGGLHSLALRADGTVVAWGDSGYGQRPVPTGLQNVVQISAGQYHSMALRADGTVVTWGALNFTPAGLKDVIAIAAGNGYSMALRFDGTIVAWDAGGIAVDTPADLRAHAIAASRNFRMALKTDGTVAVWYGHAPPAGLSNVVAIAAGDYHALALKADGTVVGWSDYSPPAVPSGLNNVARIAVGTEVMYAIKHDGSVVTWGYRADPISATRHTPALGVSATEHTLILRATAADSSPVIVTQPADATGVSGGSHTFSVNATGGALAYRWRFNGTDISGATNASYTLSTLYSELTGTYDVVISNYLGAVTSRGAQLIVGTAPQFSSHPQSASVGLGGTVVLSYAAWGTTPMTIQWRKDGNPLSGATNSTYRIDDFQPSHSGSYTVALTNALGSATSNAGVLSSTASNPPSIYSHPSSATLNVGNVASFSVGASSSSTLYYQWRKNGVVIPGATSSQFIPGAVQVSDSGIYDVVVSHVGGAIVSNPAHLNVFSSALGIITHPAASSVYLGNNATFTVTPSGTAPFTYQWRKNGFALVGSTAATLTLSGVQFSDAGVYSVTVSNAAGSFTSNGAALTLITSAPFIFTQPSSTSVTQGSPATFTVGASGGPLTYQWRRNAVNIPGASNSTFTLTNVSTADAGSYSVVVSNLSASATSGSATLTVNTPPVISTQPVALSLNLGSSGTLSVVASGAPSPAYQWRKGGVNVPGATNASLIFSNIQPASAGSYDVVVTNIAGFVTSTAAQVTVNTLPPTLSTQPVGGTIGVGATFTFSVSASGSPPLTYTWRRNGVDLGHNAAQLILGSAQSYDTGDYDVTVSSPYGTVTSSTPRLVVQPRPVTVSTRVVLGSSEGAAAVFTVEGSSSKHLLLRAVGPSLSLFGFTNAVPDPHLEVFNDAGQLIAANDNWGSAANAAAIANTFPAVGAFGLPGGSRDAAILQAFAPGTYTVRASGVSGVGGVAHLELFDADVVPNNSRLPFLAVRALVVPGESMMIGGLASNGRGVGSFLIRAIGPGLGLPGAFANPALSVAREAVTVGANDDWSVTSTHQAEVNAAVARVATFPLAEGSRDAAIVLNGNLHAGAHTVQVGGSAASGLVLLEFHDLAESRPAAFAPAIVSAPSSRTVTAGGALALHVHALGSAPLSYQWRRDGVNISGATSASYSIGAAQAGDGGVYTVAVTNSLGSATSIPAIVTVSSAPGALAATHGVIGSGYRAGSRVTVSNTFSYTGSPASLGWRVTLPAGWSYAGGTNEGDVKPVLGATGALEWAWTEPPAGSVTFSYQVNVPSHETGAKTLTATAHARIDEVLQSILAGPNPLVLLQLPAAHSGDPDQNYRIDLTELTRVIELYNTRFGTVRTGAYTVPLAATEDGFAPDPSRSSTAVVALSKYHSADTRGATAGTPPDGKIDVLELTRVIELFNYRAGTVRTGEYRVQAGTEDGFAPGP